MTTTSDHQAWTCRDADCHEWSDDGVCNSCDGMGERTCNCVSCGDEHESECEHCDGTGVCPEWAPLAKTDQASARDAAVRAWKEFLELQSFPVSRDGFRQAWQRMFGSPTPASAEVEWVKKVVRLSRAAGEEVRL
jgi:hypothetical protein